MPDRSGTTVMTQTIARLLLAPSLMVAAAVLVKGYADTGDGFSAGVIAALGILLQYLAFGVEISRQLPVVRWVRESALVGLLISLVVTFLPVVRGEAVMTHAPAPNAKVIHVGSLELITAVVFDVGVFLLVFGFAVGSIDLVARSLARVRS
jgi:multisubunit Na+/H+ antiporter MnhB subunit